MIYFVNLLIIPRHFLKQTSSAVRSFVLHSFKYNHFKEGSWIYIMFSSSLLVSHRWDVFISELVRLRKWVWFLLLASFYFYKT